MKTGRLWGLLIVLSMGFRVNGEGNISSLIKDIMITFRLTSPTIVYDNNEAAPEICYSDQWVLCLQAGVPPRYPEDNTKELANKSESDKEFIYDGMLEFLI